MPMTGVRTEKKTRNAGFALLTTVMVVFLLATLGTAYMLTAVTEKDVSMSHAVALETLLAADAGVEVSLQQVHDYAETRMADLVDQWPGYGPVITDPGAFFPAQGFTHQCADPNYSSRVTLAFQDSTLLPSSQTFDYYFIIRSTGRSGVWGTKKIRAEGKLRVSFSRGTFSDFLLFTDVHTTPEGYPIWFHTSGHFDGRVHTNTIMRFAYYPTFEDLVTSVDQMAWFFNHGRPVKLDADRNGNRDVPNFYGGFVRGAPRIDMPQNSFSQMRASLGLDPADTSPLTEAEIRAALGIQGGNPNNPPPDGVYVPNTGTAVTGGIFIQGNANDVSLSVDHNGHQVITVTHQNRTTTTIVIDDDNNRTVVDDGSNQTVYQGVPRGVLYTRGSIFRIGGPRRSGQNVPPAIEENMQLTVVSEGDMVIQSDITYEDYDNGDCVLGLFSSQGNIRIGTSAPDDLMIDAFIMASADRKCFTVDNYWYGNFRGTVHLRGGVAESRYGAFGTFGRRGMTGYGRDFRYDSRGVVPPYWPTTTLFAPDDPEPQIISWTEE